MIAAATSAMERGGSSGRGDMVLTKAAPLHGQTHGSSLDHAAALLHAQQLPQTAELFCWSQRCVLES
jgi:hypothetical protein